MRSAIIAAAAGTALCLTLSIANAADMPMPVPPPIPVDDFGGWYLRGDIGISNQKAARIWHSALDNSDFQMLSESFSAGSIFGFGVGYQFNSWLRFDVTGEYRGNSTYNAAGFYTTNCTNYVTGDPANFCDDVYKGRKSEWTFLANGYVDLGTWYNVTPFVGAGIGVTRNTLADMTDFGATTNSVWWAESKSTWHLAWALHAGLAYKVSPNLTVELAYRYLDLGRAESEPAQTVGDTGSPFVFNDLISHDVKLGIRWHLQPEPMMPMRPLVTKG